MALFAVTSGWFLGLALGQWAGFPPGAALGLAALSAVAILLARRQRSFLIAALAVTGLLIGLLRVGGLNAPSDARPLRTYLGDEVTLVGEVTGEPVARASLTRVHLAVERVKTPDEALQLTDGAVAWLLPADARGLVPGDLIAVSGVLDLPPTFPDFDYRATLERRGISVALFRPTVSVLERVSGPARWLTSLRTSLGDSLSRSLPATQASLARTLLFGQRDGLTSELRDEWSRAGTAHLLSISGLHIGVLLGVALAAGTAIFGRRRYLYLLLPLVAIWSYAALSGLGLPVQRAAVMGTLYLTAIAVGRQSSGGLALILAAAVMAGLDPAALGEASFQLSFAAMAGLIYLSSPIEAVITRVIRSAEPQGSTSRFLVTGVSASLGAVIGITPLLSYHFGATSLLSVPATMLALPVLPFILLTSAVTAIVGLLGDLPGQIAGWLAWPWLAVLLSLSSAFARAPFASISIGPLSAFWVVAAYTALALALWRPLLGRPGGPLGPAILSPGVSTSSRGGVFASWTSLVGLALMALFFSAAVFSGTTRDPTLRVTVLDVGQGEAILVQAPAGRRVLVDGGPDPRLLEQRLAEELPWWSRRIDLVVLTHPNADHQAGLVGLIERRQVGAVLDPMLSATTDLDSRWRSALAESGLLVVRATEGMRIDLADGAFLEVLNPPARRLTDTPSDVDNNAVVLRLTYGRASFLLSSDIFDLAETYMVENNAPLSATVLKVPHHGSAGASGERFLDAVDPLIAVISVGSDNRFGHPTQEALDRLMGKVEKERIFRTDRQGSINFRTDGERLWVETQRMG